MPLIVCKIKSANKNPNEEIYFCQMFGCRHILRNVVLYILRLGGELENTGHVQSLTL